jgi:hypothetical protein
MAVMQRLEPAGEDALFVSFEIFHLYFWLILLFALAIVQPPNPQVKKGASEGAKRG